MKKILSFILVICMLMTVAPVATFAQTADFTFKPEATTYTAKVGETVSVPVLLVPTADSVTVQVIGLNIEAQTGLTVTATAGKVPVSNSNGVNVDGNMVKVLYDAETVLTPDDAVLFTLNCTATTAGTYTLTTIIDELYDADYEVLGDASNVALQNATITFEAEKEVVEDGLAAYKPYAVYYDADEHYEVSAGSGLETSWVSKETDKSFYLWDLTNEEEAAAMRAHTSYESQKSNLESNITTNNAKWATLVSGDSGYKFTNKDGVPALFTTTAATGRATDNWCRYTAMNFYFKATEMFTDADNNLTFIVQYLDEGTANITLQYINTSHTSGFSGTSITFPRTGSGEWVTKAVSVTDAKLTPGLSNTGLQDGKKTIKISSGGIDTYINAIAVMKTSDYETILAGGTPGEETDADRVAIAKNALNLSSDTVTADFTLPTLTGYEITWASDNAAIAVDGTSAKVTRGETDATVKLTATITYGEATDTKEFTVTVPAVEVKYSEYIFGFDADKGYNATSYNDTSASIAVDGNPVTYNTVTVDGLVLKNKLINLGEQTDVYLIKNAANEAEFVDVDTYNAYEGSKGAFKTQYINPFSYTGDSNTNRYAKMGPADDQRDAIFGVGHVRLDNRLGGNASISSMIHLNVNGAGFTSTDNQLTVEVDMLDARGNTDKIHLQYVSAGGAVKSAYSNERPENDGTWKTFTFTLTDADFSKESGTGLGDSKQDFRVNCAGLPTAISAMRVYNTTKKILTDADYTTVSLRDYDIVANADGSITAKEVITAEAAADAKLYVAYYNAKGDLIGVATSDQVKDGVAQTVVTGASVGSINYNPLNHTLKTFLWDADLKPLR